VRSGSAWELVAPDDTLAARALVGGPRMQRGSLKATVTVTGGGLALIAQQVAPGRALVAELVPGEKARLVDLAGATVCTGDIVALPATGATATLAIGDGVTVTLDDTELLACDHEATDSGQWGLAALGKDARVAVTAITLKR